MRMRHVLAVAITVGAVMVMNPVAARADGGAYMEFDRTHYLPGDVATAEAYVYLLKPQQGRLDRGPFYAYLVTTNRSFPQIGTTHPRGSDPPGDVPGRGEPAEVVRAEGLVHGAGRGG